MTPESAIKPRLTPDSYRCTWLIPDESGELHRLQGDVELRSSRPPRGVIYANVPGVWGIGENVNVASFPQFRNYPILRGELINGLDVVLYDAEVMSWADERAIIDPKCALVGPRSTSQGALKFDALRIQVSHMDSLFGVAPIKSHTIPRGERVHLSGTWSVEQEPESTQVWSDSHAKLTMSYSSKISTADPYHFRMTYSPICVIELVEAVSLEDVMSEWVDPIHRLITLATGKGEDLTYLSLRPESEGAANWQTQLQVYGSGVTQRPFTSAKSEVMKTRSVFTYRGDQMSALCLSRLWQKMSSSHHPLVETYGNFIVTKGQHPRAAYLLLVQALEGLHGHEHKAREEARETSYAVEREALLEVVKGQSLLTGPQFKFLKKNLNRKPPVSLDSRLKDIFAELPQDVTGDLAATDLIRAVTGESSAKVDVFNSLRIIRNDLAHGNRGYDTQGLYEVTVILEKVARAHMLRVLGCDTEIQHRVFVDD